MDTFPEADRNTVTSSIAAIRQAWLDSVRAGDAERLAAMVTDDVVVVHGNGRCVHGRDELKTDFQKGFEAFSIEQNVSSAEVVVRVDGLLKSPKSKVDSPHIRAENQSTSIPSQSLH